MPDRQGSDELHIRIGRLRDAARAEASSTPAAAREQLGLEDATIRVAAGLAGKNGAERRQVMRDVQVGRTVTPNGRVAKTTLTREEKAARTLSWAKTLTEDQREQFLLSDRFEGLSDSQQEAISEAFAEASDLSTAQASGLRTSTTKLRLQTSISGMRTKTRLSITATGRPRSNRSNGKRGHRDRYRYTFEAGVAPGS